MKKFIKNKKILLLLILLGIFTIFSQVLALELTWPAPPGGTALSDTTTLPEMVEYFYRWGIAIGGLAAFIALVWAGFLYLTSAGDPAKIKDAKDRITAAISGLVLLLASFLILNTINPELTTLRPPSLAPPISNLPPVSAGTPPLSPGYSGETIKYPDDSCEAWGNAEPKCDEFCYDMARIYGKGSFGLVVGASPDGGRDEAWCTFYNNPKDVKLAKKAFQPAGEPCECKGDATPQCGDYCFEECQNQGYSFGTVTGCYGPPSVATWPDPDWAGTDAVWCTCWDTPGIKFTEVKTVKVGERCECRGDAAPQCGDFCLYYCVEKEEEDGYNIGYIPGPQGCLAGGGTDVAWCTCMKYRETQCNNNTDDDGDGKIDYPEDPGCSSKDDDDESS